MAEHEMQPLVEMLMKTGQMTRSDATMIVDLGRHAVSKAIDTIGMVTNAAPDSIIRGAAYMTALRILQVNITELIQEIHTKAEDVLR